MNSARSSLSYDSMSPREVSSTPSLGTRDSYSMQSTSTPSPREAADRSAPLLTLLAFAAERRSFEFKNESPTRVEIPHNTSSRSSAPPAPAAPSNATSSTTRNGEFVSFAPRSSERKRAKKRASHDMEIGGTSCAWCGKTQTPQWRRCRQTQETLCNSCGLKSARRERKLKAQRTQLLQQQQDNDY
mmetsp:Transcript_13776/g.23778  ORF Transcript_13776/g.23778 Transcript_13776/m.23778 type:complete len:186 (-) Transcript_13776:171-728(-)